MYVIIIGSGSLGTGIAKELSLTGHDVAVVDKDSSAFKGLGSEFNGLTVTGTGIDVDVLKKAGAEQGDVFIAVTSNDSVNIMAAQVAKHIFKIRKVIARIFNPEKHYVYSELGIDTICPNTISIGHVKSIIQAEEINVMAQLGAGDVEILKIKVTSKLFGTDIRNLEIPYKFKVFSIIRNTETIIPQDGFVLESGDVIVAAARIDAFDTIKDITLDDER